MSKMRRKAQSLCRYLLVLLEFELVEAFNDRREGDSVVSSLDIDTLVDDAVCA